MAELGGGLLAQVRGPFGLDLGLGLPGDLDRGPAALGDLHQPGAGVAGIGDPADVAGPLELVDQEARGLLGDQGALGQVGEPSAVRVDPGEHAPLRGGRVAEAGRGQVREHPGLHGAVDDEGEQADVRLVPRVIFGHEALDLDRFSYHHRDSQIIVSSCGGWSRWTGTRCGGPSNRAGLLLAMARHQDRSSGFQREVAATRALGPVPGFETLLRAWCGYMAEILPVARALEAAYITG